MADFGAELLMNPIMTGEVAAASTTAAMAPLEIEVLDDLTATSAPQPPAAPSWMTSAPSMDEPKVFKSVDFGAPSTSDGFRNANFGPPPPTAVLSTNDINIKKRKLLSWMERKERLGVAPRKRLSMDSPLDEIEAEAKAMRSDSDMEFWVGLMRNGAIGASSVAEMAADKMPKMGVKLKGFSQNVQDNVDELQDPFEQIYEEYEKDLKMSPLYRVAIIMVKTAMVTHSTNAMMEKFGPGAGDVMKNNPELAKQFGEAFAKQATASSVAPPAPPPASLPSPVGSSLPRTTPPANPMTTVNNWMAQGMGVPAAQPPKRTMKGPSADTSLPAGMFSPPAVPEAPPRKSPKGTPKRSITLSI